MCQYDAVKANECNCSIAKQLRTQKRMREQKAGLGPNPDAASSDAFHQELAPSELGSWFTHCFSDS